MARPAARAIVAGERVGAAIECELPAGDAVAHAANQGAEEGCVGRITLDRVETEGDIGEATRAVGGQQADDGAAEIGDGRREAGRMLEDVEPGLAAVGEFAEGLHSEKGEGRPGAPPQSARRKLRRGSGGNYGGRSPAITATAS